MYILKLFDKKIIKYLQIMFIKILNYIYNLQKSYIVGYMLQMYLFGELNDLVYL